MPRYRRLIPAVLLLSLLVGSGAQARSTSYDAIRARPAVDARHYFTVYDSRPLGKLNFQASFEFDYIYKPVRANLIGTTVTRTVVKDLYIGHVIAAMGFIDGFGAGVDIPVVFYESYTDPASNANSSTTAMGDIELDLKASFFELAKFDSPVGLALVPFVTFPTGRGSRFIGNNSFTFGGKLVVDNAAPLFDMFNVALNVGYRARSKMNDPVLIADVNDEFLYGLGLSLQPIPMVEIVGEATGYTEAGNFFKNKSVTAAEIGGGVRLYLGQSRNIGIAVGGTAGMTKTLGSPKFRAFSRFSYEFKSRVLPKPIAMSYYDLSESCPPPADYVAGQDPEGCPKFYDLVEGCPTPENYVPGRDPVDCPKIYDLPGYAGGRWAVFYLGDDFSIVHTPRIQFELGSAKLTVQSEQVLAELARLMKAVEDRIATISVEGHTCTLGSEAQNLALSRERAESVKNFLITRGIPEKKLFAVGFGPRRSIADNDTEAGREQNRRVEFVVIPKQ